MLELAEIVEVIISHLSVVAPLMEKIDCLELGCMNRE